jgi:small subunit ribosomal protein S4
MGDPRKQHKKYARPRKLFDKARITEENELLTKYGLKNKKEVWKAEFKINNIRSLAKEIIREPEKQKEFLDKLKKQGFDVKTIDDVLGLTKEDVFARRLQTVIIKKGIARTARHARQLIAHKHISVSGKIVNSPSYLVSLELEKDINLAGKINNKVKKEAI